NGPLDLAQFRQPDDFVADGVARTAELPGVDHVTDQLPFIRIAGTKVNLDFAVIVSHAASQSWREHLPPERVIAAREKSVVIFGIHEHAQAHLMEIAGAFGFLARILGS